MAKFDDINIFPHLAIKRIILSGNRSDNQKIKVEASLSTDEGFSSSYWLRTADLAQYVKFYFIVHAGRDVDAFASKLLDPVSRVQNILPGPNFTPETWADHLEIGLRADRAGLKIIGLDEIIQQYNDRRIDFSATETADSDFYFEVDLTSDIHLPAPPSSDVPMSPFPGQHHREGRFFGASQVTLLAFSHLDLGGLIGQYNLDAYAPNSITDLAKFGGNLTYDTILDRSGDGSFLLPPATREVFFLRGEENTPYVGPAHYWSANDPMLHHDEEGNVIEAYVGWAAGTSTYRGAKLTSRNVQNSKIVANGFIEDSQFVSNYHGTDAFYMAEDESLPFLGTENPPDMQTFRNMLIDMDFQHYNNLNEKIEKFIKKSLNTKTVDFITDREEWISIVEEDNAPLSDNRLNTDGADNTVQLGNNCHNVFFSIDYKKTIKANSKFGFLLQMAEDRNQNHLIKEMLKGSEIKEFKMFRRRLTNSAHGNNLMGTPAFEKYDNNEIDKLLIVTKDAPNPREFKNQLHAAFYGAPGSRIQEVNTSYPHEQAGGAYIRSFHLKDYELFQRYQDGKYTYTLNLRIEDGIKKYLISQFNAYMSAFQKFQKFLSAARLPYRSRNRFYGGNELYRDVGPMLPISSGGNYDYERRDYTEDFKRSHNSGPEIVGLITQFMLIRNLLGVPITWAAMETIHKQINPTEGGTLEFAELFAERVSDLEKRLLDILDKDVFRDPEEFHHTGAPTNVSNRFSDSAIDICADLNIVVDAFRDGEILQSMGMLPVDSEVFRPMNAGIRAADLTTTLTLLSAASIPAYRAPAEGAIELPPSYQALPMYASSTKNIEPSGLYTTEAGKSKNIYSPGAPISKAGYSNLKWSLGSQGKYKKNNDIHEFSKMAPSGKSDSGGMDFQSLFQMPSTVVTFPSTRLLMNISRTRSGNTDEYFGLSRDTENIICSAAVQKLGTEQLFKSLSSVWTGIYDLRNDLGTAFDMTLDVINSIAVGPEMNIGNFNAGTFGDFMSQDIGVMQVSTGGSFAGDGFSDAAGDSFGSNSNSGQVQLTRITRITSAGTGARQVNNVGFITARQNSDRREQPQQSSGDQTGGRSYGQRF